jgi:hypothetical protein
MIDTNITVPADVWLYTLLHKLVCGERAGIASDEFGHHCLYCTWGHDDYRVEPRHEPTCPIVLGRAALKRTEALA